MFVMFPKQKDRCCPSVSEYGLAEGNLAIAECNSRSFPHLPQVVRSIPKTKKVGVVRQSPTTDLRKAISDCRMHPATFPTPSHYHRSYPNPQYPPHKILS
jgi:hypothetical protein